MSSDNIIPFANRRVIRNHMEVMAIAKSWGDTMDDEEMLAALRELNQTGSMFDDVTDRAVDH